MDNKEYLPAEKLDNHRPHERFRQGAPLERLIQQWRETRREDIHRKVAAGSAAASRKKYRLELAAEGKTVRRYFYHNHETQTPKESREDYERRLRRDRARTKRGVDAQTVRAWTDLSAMSDEEKLLHQRMLAKERKARSRSQQKKLSVNEEPILIGDASTGLPLEWGMF